MRFGTASAIGLLAGSLALGACASSNAAPPSARQQAATGEVGIAFLQWTGKFKTMIQATNSIGGGSRNVAYGDVRLTAIDMANTRAQINFSIDESTAISDNYPWSISSGECRSNSIPLIPVNLFPPIAIVNNRGSLDANVGVALPTSGRYHVNIFWTRGADESDVMACAELTLEPRSKDH